MYDHHHAIVSGHRAGRPAGSARAVPRAHAAVRAARGGVPGAPGGPGLVRGTREAMRQARTVTQRRATAAPALLCQREPDLFFSDDAADLRLAKELCGHCPLRAACLTGARERAEPWGVWGGELFLNGEIIPGKRPRGRPRKSDVAA